MHPRFGEQVEVLYQYGAEGVWVETADGKRTILRTAWTDLHPHAALAELHKRPVLLAPEPLAALARWVQVRVQPTPRSPAHTEVGPTHQCVDTGVANEGTGRAASEEEQRSAGARSCERSAHRRPAALVGHARAPSTGREGSAVNNARGGGQ